MGNCVGTDVEVGDGGGIAVAVGESPEHAASVVASNTNNDTVLTCLKTDTDRVESMRQVTTTG